MRPIITEELRFRKRICELAIKDGNNAEAARRYHTSRQQVQRWLKRYDGTIDSLRPLRRRPHTQPNQHTIAELAIVRQMNTRYRHEGVGSSIRRVVNGDILVHMDPCVGKYVSISSR